MQFLCGMFAFSDKCMHGKLAQLVERLSRAHTKVYCVQDMGAFTILRFIMHSYKLVARCTTGLIRMANEQQKCKFSCALKVMQTCSCAASRSECVCVCVPWMAIEWWKSAVTGARTRAPLKRMAIHYTKLIVCQFCKCPFNERVHYYVAGMPVQTIKSNYLVKSWCSFLMCIWETRCGW